jgi:hopene-associated glycosyltransferase HpnB
MSAGGIEASQVLALAALAAWVYLLLGRGSFWRADVRDDGPTPRRANAAWPDIAAVVPARNEAATLPLSLASLATQDYPGVFAVIVVDDMSEDGTAAVVAEVAANSRSARHHVSLLAGTAVPPGWTGKLWAAHQGLTAALERMPDYVLLTDADIVHAPDLVRSLVARAEVNGLALVSLMAELRRRSPAERALVPAFVFFFQMLYPFRWVNQRANPVAAAAGGCMLVSRAALVAAGGVAAIKGALIDDCALARRIKLQGPIWLALTHRARSIRAYPTLGDVRRMVARSAYAELGYSPWHLAGMVAALSVAFLAAPCVALLGSGGARLIALLSWVLMALAFLPTLRFYGAAPLWAPLLPGIAALYVGFTLDSAYQYLRGRGGMWKGRAQASQSDR